MFTEKMDTTRQSPSDICQTASACQLGEQRLRLLACGSPATGRNWNSVLKIGEMIDARS